MFTLILLVGCRCGFDAYGGGSVTVTWRDVGGEPVGEALVFPGFDADSLDTLAAEGFDGVRGGGAALAAGGQEGAVVFTPLGDPDAAWIEAFGPAGESFATGLGGDCTADVAWGALRLYRDFDGQDGLSLEFGEAGSDRPRVRATWAAPTSCTGDALAGACEGPVEQGDATCAADVPPGGRLEVSWAFDDNSQVRVKERCVEVY